MSSTKKKKKTFSFCFADLFGTHYETDVEQVTEEYQSKISNLQYDKSMKSKVQFESTKDFYNKYVLPSEKYKNIFTNVKLIIPLFGCTYASEQLFSKMKYIKSLKITGLCDDHIDILLLSSTITSPDVEKLSNNKQKQMPF